MKSKLLIFLLVLLSCSAWKSAFQVDDWLLEREKKGIKVFTKKSRWGKLRDSKAVMLVGTSPDEMAKMITDFDNYPQWVPRCKKANILARLNENEFIARIVFNAPWPVADRDCVIRVKVDKDPKTGIITIKETSEPKYCKTEENCVRIEQMIGEWKLVPKGDKTEVINQYASNPGGGLPDWLTNTQAVDAPFETFEGLLDNLHVRK